VLLIVAALSVAEISSFIDIAHEVAMDVLVEVHDEHELDIAITAGARLIGVNQRDLATFVVDHERAVRMGAAIPSDIVSVAESGVRGRDDAVALRNAGYDAILVGEHLVIAPDPIQALSELLV
jgi:indole-3-glycerol phosphate synthase